MAAVENAAEGWLADNGAVQLFDLGRDSCNPEMVALAAVCSSVPVICVIAGTCIYGTCKYASHKV